MIFLIFLFILFAFEQCGNRNLEDNNIEFEDDTRETKKNNNDINIGPILTFSDINISNINKLNQNQAKLVFQKINLSKKTIPDDIKTILKSKAYNLTTHKDINRVKPIDLQKYANTQTNTAIENIKSKQAFKEFFEKEKNNEIIPSLNYYKDKLLKNFQSKQLLKFNDDKNQSFAHNLIRLSIENKNGAMFFQKAIDLKIIGPNNIFEYKSYGEIKKTTFLEFYINYISNMLKEPFPSTLFAINNFLNKNKFQLSVDQKDRLTKKITTKIKNIKKIFNFFKSILDVLEDNLIVDSNKNQLSNYENIKFAQGEIKSKINSGYSPDMPDIVNFFLKYGNNDNNNTLPPNVEDTNEPATIIFLRSKQAFVKNDDNSEMDDQTFYDLKLNLIKYVLQIYSNKTEEISKENIKVDIDSLMDKISYLFFRDNTSGKNSIEDDLYLQFILKTVQTVCKSKYLHNDLKSWFMNSYRNEIKDKINEVEKVYSVFTSIEERLKTKFDM